MSEPNLLTCKEAFAKLDDYLDRELSAEEMEQVERHLALCKHCAEEFDFEIQITRKLRASLSRLDMPADLLARVQHALDRDIAS